RIMELMKAAAAEQGMDKEPALLAITGRAAALEGRRAEAERILAELERRSHKEYVEPLIVTWLCAALHDRNSLIKWFERGYEQRSSLFVYSPLNKDIYAGMPEIEA